MLVKIHLNHIKKCSQILTWIHLTTPHPSPVSGVHPLHLHVPLLQLQVHLLYAQLGHHPDQAQAQAAQGLHIDNNPIESDDDEERTGAAQDVIKREIHFYQAEPLLDRDCDPLDWWRERRSKYPNLVRLVRKYLCVPATSTQAERMFSALGLLLTKRRLAMTGENTNMQLFLKDNLEI
eukprot:GFUD01045066.1.p1 GENE.GFUD01045066.1~~GFUD01045066.1.p1  ORF type:complete len:178 (-),score=35.71 GFUD01045066.1:80-613(-)